MTAARYSHTATLLSNGKVLVTGGANGSISFVSTLISAEIFDSAAGTWSATGNLTDARAAHTATLLASGKVLVAGGVTGWVDSGLNSITGGNYSWVQGLSTAMSYDPSTGTWSQADNLTDSRFYHTATLLSNGKVLVAGGAWVSMYSDIATASSELYW